MSKPHIINNLKENIFQEIEAIPVDVLQVLSSLEYCILLCMDAMDDHFQHLKQFHKDWWMYNVYNKYQELEIFKVWN